VFKYLRLELIILAILAVVSLGGLLLAGAQPAMIESKTTRLSYEHSAKFDYLAYLNPSYLLGPEPTPPASPAATPAAIPQSALKYPADMLERFNFTFDYQFESQQPLENFRQRISASASAQDADKKALNIVLLPVQTLEGPASQAKFYLAPDNLTGDITLNIMVEPVIQTPQGPLFESFNQVVTLKREGPMYAIKREELTKSQNGRLGNLLYQQQGDLDFTALLKTTSALGGIEVSPPPLPVVTPTPLLPPVFKVLKPGDAIYTKLLNRIEASLQYQLKGAQSIRNLDEEVTVVVVIEAAKAWSKTLVVVPVSHQNGNFKIPFNIEIARYLDLIESIRKETGVTADAYQLTVRADIHVTGQTDYGDLDEVFIPTLTSGLDKNVLAWTEKLTQSKLGSFETAEIIPNTQHYLGLSRVALRNLGMILFIVFTLAFLASLWWYGRHKPAKLAQPNEKAEQYRKKFGPKMVEGAVCPKSTIANLVQVNSIEDLLKIADQLDKPLIHHGPAAPSTQHLYQVLDGATAYQYTLDADDHDARQPD
jgi:hypothetical protein